MNSLYDLLKTPPGYGHFDLDYTEKMLHKVPDAPVVDRERFLLQNCKDKTVLHLGCGGPLHAEIEKVATKVYGVDIEIQHIQNFIYLDLDSPSLVHFKVPEDVEVTLMAEVLEHLSNPGLLLKHLRTAPGKKIITVPNGFSSASHYHLRNGYEVVNKQHVAWYSYKTLSTLVERYGYEIREWAWYKGKPLVAEGLIMVVA